MVRRLNIIGRGCYKSEGMMRVHSPANRVCCQVVCGEVTRKRLLSRRVVRRRERGVERTEPPLYNFQLGLKTVHGMVKSQLMSGRLTAMAASQRCSSVACSMSVPINLNASK